MICSKVVHNFFTIFTTCSLLFQDLFNVFSKNFSQLVHDLFTTFSHFFFTTSLLPVFSQLVKDLFRISSFGHNFFMTCSLFVHKLFLTFPNLLIICSRLVHKFSIFLSQLELFRTCSFENYFFVTCSQFVQNLFITCK